MRAPEEIPEHLLPYLVQQDASLYTAIDHATWRFILRISRQFFANNAHKKYLDGLVETGISTERIPLISEMDHCLRKFGWRAVAVSGFIPPAAFMEFQSLGVLPIACDMRKIENLAYTPAPDIVHEAAGHAPIIADPEYAAYLRRYGEVSRKALLSQHDLAVYQAIRNLSEVKENPEAVQESVDAAQKRLDSAMAAVDFESEASLLARMNWWTVEYGLVGPTDDPKIYGAGLLSSVGESQSCLGSAVRKIPLTVDCVRTPYDITRPQPQLFVARDFGHLVEVLDEFAGTMAYRRGGGTGLSKALQAGTVATVELDSGIQIGGVLSEVLSSPSGQPAYLRFSGPSQLAFGEIELDDQGPRHHPEGFGTPVGRPTIDLTSLSEAEVSGLTQLEFPSGIRITGRVSSQIRKNGRLLVISWQDCRVTLGNRVLFEPSWGAFDMAIGAEVSSVFGGAPDRASYLRATEQFPQRPAFQKTNLTDDNLKLNHLYEQVREIRESGRPQPANLAEIHRQLSSEHPEDWLLCWELLELDRKWDLKAPWAQAALSRLASAAARDPQQQQIIRRGMELLQ